MFIKLNLSFTRSVGKKPFDVDVVSDKRVRIWKEILDRNDGSYLVRMRFFETVENIEITIKHKGKHVGNSPYKVKGNFRFF